MASIVLSSIGTSIGNELIPGLGGRILGSYARQAGKWIDVEIGLREGTAAKDGPRLDSLRVQDSRYGNAIPVVYGCARVAGNVVWASSLIEASHESQSSGGKGGAIGGTFGNTRTTYTYSVHCAVAVCVGPIGGIATIWADSKIIYQNGVWKTGVVGNATFYTGTADQNVDPFLESLLGSGDVPAYRGMAYVVLESLQLNNFGNRLPNLTFEVLPADSAPQPSWLGAAANPGIHHLGMPLRNRGMPPLIVEGREGRARKMLVGGYETSAGNAAFSVIAYDVTGDAPVEVKRTSSTAFAISNVGDHAWALAPDGRFIAFYMQDSSQTPYHHIVIYDIENNQFGNVLELNLELVDDSRQIAWLDAQRFVVTDVADGKRGVHVFARAGLDVTALGFFDVWGAGTASTRVPSFYMQFLPMAGGLLNIMTDYVGYFTALYVRPIVWQGGGVVAGPAYTLTSGFDSNLGAGPQACLLRTGDGEWTLFFSTVINMAMLSFRPGTESAVITRPWQILNNAAFSVGTTTVPMVFGNRIVAVQRSSMDNFYRLTEIALRDGFFELVNDGAIVADFALPVTDFGAAAIDGTRLLLMGLKGFDNSLEQLGIIRRRHTGDMLDSVVAGILARAGYAEGDYALDALADVPVDGFVIPATMTAAAAIAPLQILAPFDLVESEGQLRAVRHAHEAGITVPVSEAGATVKQTFVPVLEEARTQESDLPLEIRVDFADASRDYETGSQRARRSATRGARVMAAIRLPLVCTAATAKKIAEERLFDVWAGRDHARFFLSRRWLALEPGDVVRFDNRLVRVAHVRQSGGVVEVTGVFVPAAAAESRAEADGGAWPARSAITPVESSLYLMDLPLLRAADDQPGVYAAVSGIDGWPGASLWRAADGVNYGNVANFGAAATAGMAVSVLPDRPFAYMDRASTVHVQLLRGTLAGCTGADLLNGANAALIGDEVVQFQNATLVGPGLYALSYLLRGRRGTESATGSHATAERFVLLTEDTVQFMPALLTDRGRTYQFRALSNGQALGDAPDVGLAYALATLRPFAPVHVTGIRAGGSGSDLTLSWKRRARTNGDWIDNVDVPLDEPGEFYDVAIMNGANVIRTFDGVTEPSVVYTAAQQTADWGGSIPATFTVNVYQLSARYGRGQGAAAQI